MPAAGSGYSYLVPYEVTARLIFTTLTVYDARCRICGAVAKSFDLRRNAVHVSRLHALEVHGMKPGKFIRKERAK